MYFPIFRDYLYVNKILESPLFRYIKDLPLPNVEGEEVFLNSSKVSPKDGVTITHEQTEYMLKLFQSNNIISVCRITEVLWIQTQPGQDLCYVAGHRVYTGSRSTRVSLEA